MKTILLTLTIFCSMLYSKATEHIITFANYSYSPASIQLVQVGDTITWSGEFGDHPLASGVIPQEAASFQNSTGQVFKYKVLVPGIYNYYCTNHSQFDMKGSFSVVGASGISNTVQESGLKISITTNNLLTLETGTSLQGKTLQLINAEGRVCQHIDRIESDRTILSVEELPAGIYIVAVRDKNGALTQRLKWAKSL